MGTVNLEGQTWDLHVGNNGAMRVYSFVAENELGTWEGDVKKFYNYVTETQGFPADQQHLITYQFGTEPFTGNNARFDVWYWYAEQN